MSRRVLAGWRHRLAGARTLRTLLAPVTTLAAVELVGLAGPGAPAQASVVTALTIAFPFLAWSARQALDAAPDDQQRLDALALGSDRRARLAGGLAAASVVLPLALLVLAWGAVRVDSDGIGAVVLLSGGALAIGTASAATAVGHLASRRVAGPGAASLVVLVGVPVLTAVLGAVRDPIVPRLVPALGLALRAAYAGHLPAVALGLLLQLLVWSAAVVAVTQLPRVRRW